MLLQFSSYRLYKEVGLKLLSVENMIEDLSVNFVYLKKDPDLVGNGMNLDSILIFFCANCGVLDLLFRLF